MATDQERQSELEISPALNRFIATAKRGWSPGASGGERGACVLADAVVTHLSGLDQQLVIGFAEFCGVASVKPWVARELME